MQQQRQSCVLSEGRHIHCDLDLRPFDPKINGFPVLTVKHLYVKFDDPSCICF